MMVPETNDHLPTLVTSQQSGVASTASRTRSVLDPPEEDATTYSHKRARHTGGEPTSLDERADVLGRYRASYRLNRHGSGVFTLNIRDDNNSVHKTSGAWRQVTNMDYLREEQSERVQKKREAREDAQISWVRDQARLYHAQSERRANDEDVGTAQQGEGQPACRAPDFDSPADLSEEEQMDEDRVATELGLWDAESFDRQDVCPLDQSNLETESIQGPQILPPARAISENDHQVTEEVSSTPFATLARAPDGPPSPQSQTTRTLSDAGLPDSSTPVALPVPPVRTCDSPTRREAMDIQPEQGLCQVSPTNPVPFCASLPMSENSHEQGIHHAPDETPLTPTPLPARACDTPSRHEDPCEQEATLQANVFESLPEQETEKSRRPVLIPTVSVCPPFDSLSPPLQAWVLKQVKQARDQARCKTDDAERKELQKEERARQMMLADLQAKAHEAVPRECQKYLQTWNGAPELLEKEAWKNVNEKIARQLEQFDHKVKMTASTREDGYMEQVDKAGQRARAEALAKIGNVARQTSFLSTLRSADEEWLEQDTASSSSKKAEEASKKERRRQPTAQRERSLHSIGPSLSKGKARAVSFNTPGISNEQTAARPTEPTLSENIALPTEMDSFGSTTGAEAALDASDIIDLEAKAAEERRRLRSERQSMANKEKMRGECVTDRRRVVDLSNALSKSNNAADRANITYNEVPRASSSANQSGRDTYVHAHTSISQDTEMPGVVPQGVPSGTSNSGSRGGGNGTVTDAAMLNSIYDYIRTSEESTKRLASQVNEMQQTLNTVLEHGAPHANQPAQAQPPPVIPNPPRSRAQRHGPPGEPREPAPLPVRRTLKVTELHAHLREFFLELFHQGDRNYWPEPPTEDEIEDYNLFGSQKDGPTASNFRLDFSHRPPKGSVWNQRAAEVFKEQYRLSNYPTWENDAVEDEFWKRLSRMSTDYHKHLNPVGTGTAVNRRASDQAKRQRRRRRTTNLFDSRVAAVQSRMSEDESDHGGESGAVQGRRYKIVKPQWRSPEATKWLRTIDLIYVGTKINEDNTRGPGNQFRQRYPSSKSQKGHPIMGLPRNFYDARWLATLPPRKLEALRVQPEISIEFSKAERRYASKFIGIKGQLQKDRIQSCAEASESEILQWALTGKGFWGTNSQEEDQEDDSEEEEL